MEVSTKPTDTHKRRFNTHCQLASVAPRQGSWCTVLNYCSHDPGFWFLRSFRNHGCLFPLLLWLSVHDGQIRGCNPSTTHHMAHPDCHRCSDWTSMPLWCCRVVRNQSATSNRTRGAHCYTRPLGGSFMRTLMYWDLSKVLVLCFVFIS